MAYAAKRPPAGEAATAVSSARVSTKYQVVLPASVRKELRLKPGDDVVFSTDRTGALILRRKATIRDLRGLLKGCPPFEREPDDPERYGRRR